jgi:uncharacterized membrane-anchored protein YhcB (DUF1043 family)
MEITPNLWLGLAAGVLLGALCSFFLQRRNGSANRERAEQLSSELEETREELDAHREEVAKHFQETSQLFRGLTEQYTRLYAHLAEGSRDFCTDDAPALARGFDGPLLGRNGDDAGKEQPRKADPPEARPEQGNGGASAVA